MSTSRSMTASRSGSRSNNFRPTTSFTNITNDSRIQRLTKNSSGKSMRTNSTASLLQSTIDTKKYLQKLTILDIHAQTRPVKKHKPLDLSIFLIEQEDDTPQAKRNIHALPTHHDMEIQCDEILPRPVTPLKVRGKTGLDIAIQVESDDLFDFDRDVEPLLRVIVDKTLEQSLTEIRNEHVLKQLRAHHHALQCSADAEKQRISMLEEAEQRRFADKEKRVEEHLLQKRAEDALKHKVRATRMANGFLANLMDDTLNNLEELSIFRCPVMKEIESDFISKIADGATERLNFFSSVNSLVDDIVKGTVFEITRDADKNARIMAERQAMAEVIHLYVNVQQSAEKIGPLKLTIFDHGADIDRTIRTWYLTNKGDAMEDATIELTVNGRPFSKQCLGNIDLQRGAIEMKIVRAPAQDAEEQEEDDQE